MNVRPAAPEDRLRVVSLLRDSHRAAGFTFPFRGAYAEQLFKLHTTDPMACCLLLGKPAQGMLMARAYEHPFGAGLWAKETVWFIAPEARGRAALQMLDAYEAWARGLACVSIGMASLASNDVSRIYERRGYRTAETHFLKAL
jgi:hypothetical protein